MLISKIKGLKYPDESIIRFFFKERLFEKPGTVLELGCGVANNINLFYQYGYHVTGIDIDKASIENAKENLALVQADTGLKNGFDLACADMVEYVEGYRGKPVDVFMLPSSIYYLPRPVIVEVLKNIRRKGILRAGTRFFLRMRNMDDYRYGKGREVGPNSFRMDIKETGEENCTITFFSESELLELLHGIFKFKSHRLLLSRVENLQNDRIIMDSDIIFWGEIAEA